MLIMLGKRVAEARKRMGYKQVELAVALDKERSLISKVESGGTWSGMAQTLADVARELGVSVDWLVGNDDPSQEERMANDDQRRRDDEPSEGADLADAEAVLGSELVLLLGTLSSELSDEAKRSIADFIRFKHQEEQGGR